MSRCAKKQGSKGKPKLRIESYAILINKTFKEMVYITENGTKARVTVFSAIYKQLLHQEITAGDTSAMRTRLAYDKFAQEKEPDKTQEIVIVHKGKGYRRPQDDIKELRGRLR